VCGAVLPAGLPNSHNRSLTVPSFDGGNWADTGDVQTAPANAVAVAASHFRRVRMFLFISHLLG